MNSSISINSSINKEYVGGERALLLDRGGGRKRIDASANGVVTDLEHGDVVPAVNVGFSRVLALQKFGGKIIDIVSGDRDTHEQRAEALNAY
ncbi:hypothetical protein Ddye_022939 [Dipteronia dyeriana]|uniref:Uncharacterized protein n=1 Tax=Dipteronia dyeriana TaxID=168575 RepID=A0AAD9WRX1_9ROSI|nr:hypothetical protein Ddye_022939 [Dipteronia dyeriana]